MLRRLAKIKVEIPDTLAAYVFWKKAAKLTELQRGHILTSVFNRFRLDEMIEACCIQFPNVGSTPAHGTNVANRLEPSSSEPHGLLGWR